MNAFKRDVKIVPLKFLGSVDESNVEAIYGAAQNSLPPSRSRTSLSTKAFSAVLTRFTAHVTASRWASPEVQ